MSEILNAKITSTSLGYEDHGIFTTSLYLQLDSYSIGFGGYGLDEYDKTLKKRVDKHGLIGAYIKEILETVGVDEWSDLKGKLIRVRTNDGNGLSSRIDAIGHIMEDKWFSPALFFEEQLKKQTTDDTQVAEVESFEYTNSFGVTYYLRSTEVTLRDGKPQTIHYFAKNKELKDGEKGRKAQLPEGYIVRENPRNGFLTVSRYENETPEDDD